ncbi:MAG: hypothetical protein INQ03_09630 [Candidatus Heimdallarchaeota archaeon]|nr:hypothetical protein [Candidatus Heimdallarchaeota archaeon]
MKGQWMVLGILAILIIQAPVVQAQLSQNDAGSGHDAPEGLYDSLSVELNQSYSGKVGSAYQEIDSENPDKEDYYNVVLDTFGLLSVSFTIHELIPDDSGSIVKDHGEFNVENYNYQRYLSKFISVNTTTFEFDIPIIAPTTVYVSFYTEASSISYSFECWFYEDVEYRQDDAKTGDDAGYYNRVELETDTVYTGRMGFGEARTYDGTGDWADYYYFEAEAQGYMYFSVDVDLLEPEYINADFISFVIHYADNDWYSPSLLQYSFRYLEESEFRCPIPIAGTYNLTINTDVHIGYTLSMQFVEETLPIHDDFGTGTDAPDYCYSNNLGSRIPEIELNSTGSGMIGPEFYDSNYYRDMCDSYAFTIDKPSSVKIQLSSIRLGMFTDEYRVNLDLRLIKISVVEHEFIDHIMVRGNESNTMIEELQDGEYLILLNAFEGKYLYNISIDETSLIYTSYEYNSNYPKVAPIFLFIAVPVLRNKRKYAISYMFTHQ